MGGVVALRADARLPWPRRLTADPRYWQIGCLGALLTILLARGDPGVDPWQAPVCVAIALLAQYACGAVWRVTFDWRSPLITSLSLGLLFRADTPWLWALAAALAIGSKFLVRVRGKHVFNPANFAISTLLLLLPNDVWISPGQWGAEIWLCFLFAGLGLLVLQRAARLDIAATFLLAYGGLLLMRCLALGDPLTIPAHQLQSGALLLFAFFMITDPRATPDSRLGRVIFATAVALLAYHLQFARQIRPGIFLSLFLLSPAVPLIDAVLPAARFVWTRPKEA
jgi:Na+-transporting NADH:ubiquinone oxidoreductase subunit NqrB